MPPPARSVEAMTSISLRFFPITADDIDAGIAFYRDGLGLELRNNVAAGDFHWVTLGVPGTDVAVVLSEPGAGRSPDDAEALHRLVAKGAIGPIVFETDDLDGVFARLTALGADLVQEPTDQPWGPRDTAFRDPAGNLIRINQAG
jgi:catechol 2,3-dioxygenase-like lactoylglutathione lyase family enzyme